MGNLPNKPDPDPAAINPANPTPVTPNVITTASATINPANPTPVTPNVITTASATINPANPTPVTPNVIIPNIKGIAKKLGAFLKGLLRILKSSIEFQTPLGKFIRRIIICLTFDIFLGSCTIAWNYLNLLTNGSHIDLNTLNPHGELLIIAVAISGGGLANLISSGRMNKNNWSLLFGCLCIVHIVLSVGWFNKLSPNGLIPNIGEFENWSKVLYISSIGISINCRLIAGE